MRYLHCTMIFLIRNSHFDLYYLYSNTNTYNNSQCYNYYSNCNYCSKFQTKLLLIRSICYHFREDSGTFNHLLTQSVPQNSYYLNSTSFAFLCQYILKSFLISFFVVCFSGTLKFLLKFFDIFLCTFICHPLEYMI